MRTPILTLLASLLAVPASATTSGVTFTQEDNAFAFVRASYRVNNNPPFRSLDFPSTPGTLTATATLDDGNLTLAYDEFSFDYSGSMTQTRQEEVTVGIGQTATFDVSLTLESFSLAIAPSGPRNLTPALGGLFDVQNPPAFTTAEVSGTVQITGPTEQVVVPYTRTLDVIGNRSELDYQIDPTNFPNSIRLSGGPLILGSAASSPLFDGQVDGVGFTVRQSNFDLRLPPMTLNQIPEPTSAALLLLGTAVCARRRRS